MTTAQPDLVEVTQEEFYGDIYGRNLNVGPVNTNPDYTEWEYRGTRRHYGRSLPGWRHSGDPNVPKRYFLARTEAKHPPHESKRPPGLGWPTRVDEQTARDSLTAAR